MRMVRTIDMQDAMKALGLPRTPEGAKQLIEYERLGMPFRKTGSTYELDLIVSWHSRHVKREMERLAEENRKLLEESEEKTAEDDKSAEDM